MGLRTNTIDIAGWRAALAGASNDGPQGLV